MAVKGYLMVMKDGYFMVVKGCHLMVLKNCHWMVMDCYRMVLKYRNNSLTFSSRKTISRW